MINTGSVHGTTGKSLQRIEVDIATTKILRIRVCVCHEHKQNYANFVVIKGN